MDEGPNFRIWIFTGWTLLLFTLIVAIAFVCAWGCIRYFQTH